MNNEIVRLENVSVSADNYPILEDVNLSLNDDDLVAIIGPNGSGKTTLLKVILGLITPSEGRVSVFGASPAKGRKFVGYLPQYVSFDRSFPISIFDLVLMSRYKGFLTKYTKDDVEAVENALEAVEMEGFKERQIGSLSGGQLQRALLARAIAREPKLLLLDEPTASVDPEMQQTFYELMNKLKEKMAIVLISHDVGVVFTHVDKVICLNRRLFYHGPTEGAASVIEDMYECPIDLIAHGVPHRVLDEHLKKK